MTTKTKSERSFLAAEAFTRRLYSEQRRTERSRRPFALVLLESARLFGGEKPVGDEILKVLNGALRETDVIGWLEQGSTIGVIFTEITSADGRPVTGALVEKVRGLVESKLPADQVDQIRFSLYRFPEDWDKVGNSLASVLYRDSDGPQGGPLILKRCLDILGSLAALVLASPLFLAIAVAIKLTSKGPILFRQKRTGRYGREFTFLKFRSMYVNNDHALHREYVKKLIAGEAASVHTANGKQPVFKITNDPRITSVGRFLRKSSLDEIPQFLNVLKGDMSLVGPRPPIPYEVESYDIWHRRRLLEVKPGIMGLWQVNGRSRTTFDDMVRLDLQYAQNWSLWLDLKILLSTPAAVVAGEGAH